MPTLIMLRHGESDWNRKNLFTGWWDCPLSELGQTQATGAGRTLAEAGAAPTVLHTSLLSRAIITAEMALAEMGRSWIPVRRSWRLNERHYGNLTGLDKKATAERYGDEQLHLWRRSYDTPPPPIEDGHSFNPNIDARYDDLPPELVPRTECLADVVDRMLPYWYDAIVPDLRNGHVVLVAAHGNSLRALAMHLDGLSQDEVAELNLPTGVPIRYELGADMRPVEAKATLERALGDLAAVKAAAEAVAKQSHR
jgi:2,3-bisphosphoglycerate-dependent phosphoglycerate mutase